MSDLMLFGVLNMPYESAMGDELSRRQFYARVQDLVKRHGRLRASVRAISETLDDHELRQAARDALEDDERQGVNERPSASPVPPWDDLKVAFGIDDPEKFELWMEHTLDGKDLLPAGWSLCETSGAGARYVVVFRVEGPLRVEDGRALAQLLSQHGGCVPTDEAGDVSKPRNAGERQTNA